MTVLRQRFPFAFFFLAFGRGSGRAARRTAPPVLSGFLPGGIGEVKEGSVEEQIWGELGALPRSWRKRSWHRVAGE